ncbi:hypothetical protein AOY87_14085 [Escherichia coli]|nr:hypothetical protein AOY87_14085 [Escherichia coli]
MFKHYYVNMNAQPNGDHEVHTSDCTYMPSTVSRMYPGYLDNCGDAVGRARAAGIQQVNGCYFCCSECHTS